MAIVHRLALAALILANTGCPPVGAVPPSRAGVGLAAIFTRNVASSSSSSTASTQPTSLYMEGGKLRKKRRRAALHSPDRKMKRTCYRATGATSDTHNCGRCSCCHLLLHQSKSAETFACESQWCRPASRMRTSCVNTVQQRGWWSTMVEGSGHHTPKPKMGLSKKIKISNTEFNIQTERRFVIFSATKDQSKSFRARTFLQRSACVSTSERRPCPTAANQGASAHLLE